LDENPAVTVAKISSIYQTEPQNFTAQDDFFNCVCEIKTALSPVELLDLCGAIEAKLGRKQAFRYGPRLIDVDILLYDALNLSTAKLSIPHPELVRRNFALTPLREIAPNLAIRGMPLDHWMNLCKGQGVIPIGKFEIFSSKNFK
jgi:2-amino-4-hydroxy-6-hydroxymethyldihydropteridine diphosphokinase